MENTNRISTWINILLALMLLIGIALTTYAINNVRSLLSEAKGKPTPSSDNTCNNTFWSGKETIKVGKSTIYKITTCGVPKAYRATIQWGKYNPDKDLALFVTSPDGQVTSSDTDESAAETLGGSASAEGEWKVEVKNVGSKSVHYDLYGGLSY